MKAVLILISVLIGIKSFEQDTTIITNLPLQARVIEYLASQALQPDQDSVFNVYLKWRALFKATKPTGTTMVTTDTMPTALLASMYNYSLSNSEGLKMAAMIKTQIATARTTNVYLDRLCTEYEDQFATRLLSLRQSGRRLLLGR